MTCNHKHGIHKIVVGSRSMIRFPLVIADSKRDMPGIEHVTHHSITRSPHCIALDHISPKIAQRRTILHLSTRHYTTPHCILPHLTPHNISRSSYHNTQLNLKEKTESTATQPEYHKIATLHHTVTKQTAQYHNAQHVPIMLVIPLDTIG